MRLSRGVSGQREYISGLAFEERTSEVDQHGLPLNYVQQPISVSPGIVDSLVILRCRLVL